MGKENLHLIDRTITPTRLIAGDRILLMSDGVYGALSDDEVLTMMHKSPSESAKAIIRAVDEKNLPGQDNATILIIGVHASGVG